MGLFDKLKQMMGVSGVKVNLILPQNRYRQGETVTGVVKVTGGPEAKLANKLSVTLVEIFPEITLRTTAVPNAVPTSPQPGAPQTQPQQPPTTTVTEIQTEALTSRTAPCQEIILAQQFEIPAQAALEYPISINLPTQAAVNGPCQEWHLKTELDIAGAFDAADTDRITVTVNDPMQPAREFICNGAGFPTNCLLRIEAVSASGERLSNRVYYL
jgi:sporulation-control protein spo0M